MTPPPADAAALWRLEAARLRVMRRVLPAQRHEVLGALSAQKMMLAAARRQRAVPAPEAHIAWLDQLAEQTQAAQAALVTLRVWDGLVPQQRPAAEVLAQAIAWSQQECALRGHRLTRDDGPDATAGPGDSAASTETSLPVPAAHHALLGLIFHAVDSSARPQRLVWRVVSAPEAWVWRLGINPRNDAQAWPALAEPSPLAIDAEALAALVQDAGAALTVGAAGSGDAEAPGRYWDLHWPA